MHIRMHDMMGATVEGHIEFHFLAVKSRGCCGHSLTKTKLKLKGKKLHVFDVHNSELRVFQSPLHSLWNPYHEELRLF